MKQSATEKEIKAFLNTFKTNLSIWDVLFLGREKNLETLSQLEITSDYRKEVLKNLQAEDYSEGPKKDNVYGGSDMWIFGKEIKSNEVYIKISLGNLNNNQVLCISFHIAEHEMNYPLKN